MRVEGHEITEAQIDCAWSHLRHDDRKFDLAAVARELNRAGVHMLATYRGADRILQRWRKAGQIVRVKGGWQIADAQRLPDPMSMTEKP